MKLNKQQKQFLFDNYYVTARVLDAAVEPGWKDYFIKCFNWSLANMWEGKSGQKYGTLKLIDKKDKDFTYDIGLIFQGNDYFKLLNLTKK